MSAKTNQIFHFPSKIPVNTDIASEHNLVRDLEGLQIEVVPGPGKQRFQVFDEGWDTELVAPALE